jgi:hypothetical protein
MSALFRACTTSTGYINYIEMREGEQTGAPTIDCHWKGIGRWIETKKLL